MPDYRGLTNRYHIDFRLSGYFARTPELEVAISPLDDLYLSLT
jgi:hypothetical protein